MKRYAVTVDLYIYAEDDLSAVKKAKQFTKDAEFLVDKTENHAEVLDIYEAPSGIAKRRPVDMNIDDGEDDD